jgi:hypothetical protein
MHRWLFESFRPGDSSRRIALGPLLLYFARSRQSLFVTVQFDATFPTRSAIVLVQLLSQVERLQHTSSTRTRPQHIPARVA